MASSGWRSLTGAIESRVRMIVNIRCARCKSPLEIRGGSWMQNVSELAFEVLPCENCIELAIEKSAEGRPTPVSDDADNDDLTESELSNDELDDPRMDEFGRYVVVGCCRLLYPVVGVVGCCRVWITRGGAFAPTTPTTNFKKLCT